MWAAFMFSGALRNASTIPEISPTPMATPPRMLPELKQKWPASKVILLTGHGTVEAAEEAFKVDPQLFLHGKPFDPGTLRALVELALAGKPASRTAVS